MHKIVSKLIVHTHGNQVLEEQKGKEPTESTGRVLAKNPSNIKSVIEESKV